MRKINLFYLILLLLSSNLGAIELYKDPTNTTNFHLYGRFQQDFGNSSSTKVNRDPEAKGYGSFNGDTTFRLGVKSSLYVNDSLDLIGKAEFQVNAAEWGLMTDGNATLTTREWDIRYFYAGLDFKHYGTILLGRPASGTIMLTDTTDVCAKGMNATTAGARVIDRTAARMFRQDGTLQYDNKIGNLDMSTSYVVGTEKSEIKYTNASALRYTFDMATAGVFKPVVAYYISEATDDNRNLNKAVDKYLTFGGGFTYEVAGFRLGALYTWDKLTPSKEVATPEFGTNNGFEVTASYLLMDTYKFNIAYINLINDKVFDKAKNTIGKVAVTNEIIVEAQYIFNKKSFFYINYDYKMNDYLETRKHADTDGKTYYVIDSSKKPTNHVYSVGMRYNF